MRSLKLVKAPLRLVNKLVTKSRRRIIASSRSRRSGEIPLPTDSRGADEINPPSASLGDPATKEEMATATTTAAEPACEECPICHDPVGLPNPESVVESWVSLDCGHQFGNACLQTWLQETLDRKDPLTPDPTCPICRVVARHPDCGHEVAPSREYDMQYSIYQVQLWYQQRSAAAAAQEAYYNQSHDGGSGATRRPRRLQRREGHPLRPLLTPPRRMADTLGECGTCAENKRYEENMKRMKERAQASQAKQQQGEGAETLRERTTGRKAYLPGHIRIRSAGSRSDGLPSPPMDSEERAARGHSVLCRLEEMTSLEGGSSSSSSSSSSGSIQRPGFLPEIVMSRRLSF
ncbi:hypothetical protein BX600DRAFT_89198 [Xylariales sp. PMI_506]|nr:hypothetical protein BX600DRAFT_89198 [Xylariales sp. PMI_506]